MTSQRYHRVIVGYDGSPAAETALAWAAREARLHRAPLVTLTAVRERPEEPAATDLLVSLRRRLAAVDEGVLPLLRGARRFSAEQATTVEAPSASRSRIQAARSVSQGSRSASSSGTPRSIFAMFAGGWKRSASANPRPRRSESNRAMVLLPEPATPITITCVAMADPSCAVVAFRTGYW